MKKIPTLFTRIFYDETEKRHGIKEILPELSSPGLEEVLAKGIPTIKWDGTCTLIKDGKFYKRYDAKNGKTPPFNALPCEPAPDPTTGHWPHWLEVNPDSPEDKWLWKVYQNTLKQAIEKGKQLPEGTYEAIGPHWQKNPYKLPTDILIQHGQKIITDLTDRTFEGIKQWLETHNEEGIVFWYNGEPQCKIKRSDFSIPWKGYTGLYGFEEVRTYKG